ncbi:MAG TPA: methyltransferase, TIGR04325 family [Chitinophagaceae bacterium]|nr:methyltransferase, TIGR04325 family [Chitinophagaceae bacterium]
MSVKEFLPPVLTDFIRRNRKVVKYKTYQEALSHCTADAYQNAELCNIIADKTRIHIEGLKKRPFQLNATTVYLSFALNYFVNHRGKKNITVLDFGGACGAHYFEVKNTLPDTIRLKWMVVETEQMVASAIDRGLSGGELSFISSIDAVNDPVDFVHSSSTLQYVPAPFEFLQKLLSLKAKMMLFNRMMFNAGDKDIITIQRSFLSANGPGKLPPGYTDKSIMYPHTAISYDKINAAMGSGGYDCLSEFDEPTGSFSLGKENILGKGLLFIER